MLLTVSRHVRELIPEHALSQLEIKLERILDARREGYRIYLETQKKRARKYLYISAYRRGKKRILAPVAPWEALILWKLGVIDSRVSTVARALGVHPSEDLEKALRKLTLVTSCIGGHESSGRGGSFTQSSENSGCAGVCGGSAGSCGGSVFLHNVRLCWAVVSMSSLLSSVVSSSGQVFLRCSWRGRRVTVQVCRRKVIVYVRASSKPLSLREFAEFVRCAPSLLSRLGVHVTGEPELVGVPEVNVDLVLPFRVPKVQIETDIWLLRIYDKGSDPNGDGRRRERRRVRFEFLFKLGRWLRRRVGEFISLVRRVFSEVLRAITSIPTLSVAIGTLKAGVESLRESLRSITHRLNSLKSLIVSEGIARAWERMTSVLQYAVNRTIETCKAVLRLMSDVAGMLLVPLGLSGDRSLGTI